jgi:HK97 gp10 family phage protein
MAIATMKITGGKELARGFQQLSAAVGARVLRQGLTAAAEPMRVAMGRFAPREPGAPDLADHMVVSRITKIGSTDGGPAEKKNATEEAVAVGPAKDFFYGLFQEYGTARGGKFTPFARPAFDTTAAQSLQILIAVLWQALVKREVIGSRGTPTAGGGLL